MSQTAAVLTPAAVDYERTLVLSIEVSNKVGYSLGRCLACRIRKRNGRSIQKPKHCRRPLQDIAPAPPLWAAALRE